MNHQKHAIRFQAALLALAAGSLAGSAAPAGKEPSCAKFQERTMLLTDFEYCAVASNAKPEVLADAQNKKLHVLQFDKLPKDLRDRAKEVLAPEPTDRVGLVVNGAPPPGAERPQGASQSMGGGGYLGALVSVCLLGKVVDGHYELTKKALSSYEGTGIDFVASASRDADEYEWGNAAAHAQTPNEAARPFKAGNQDAAQIAFRQYIGENTRRFTDACKRDDHVEAGYVLGYLLHAIQDLSTHRGITNAQHSYFAHLNANPDGNVAYLTRAAQWSRQLVIELEKRAKPGCIRRIAKVESDHAPPASRKKFYDDKDGDAPALLIYRDLGPQYKVALRTMTPEARRAVERLWFDENGAQAFFDANVVTALGTP